MGSLVTAAVGLVVLLSALLADGRASRANQIIAGLTLVATGGPVWAWFWAAIGRHLRVDRAGELDSPLRRTYLFSVFGIGGVATMVGLLTALTTAFEDTLDGQLSRRTLHDARIGIATVVAVTGVAWYHYRVHRAERPARRGPPPGDRDGAAQPPPPTGPPILAGGRQAPTSAVGE